MIGAPFTAEVEMSLPPCVVPTVVETAPVKVGVKSTVAPYRGFTDEELSEAVTATITFAVVVDNLVGSSWDVAVIITFPAPAGAVQAPVLGFMEPALAVQVIALLTPPADVELKSVVVLTVRVGSAGAIALTTTTCGVTVTELSTTSAAAFVARNQ